MPVDSGQRLEAPTQISSIIPLSTLLAPSRPSGSCPFPLSFSWYRRERGGREGGCEWRPEGRKRDGKRRGGRKREERRRKTKLDDEEMGGGGGQKVLEPWPGARHFSVRLPQQDGLVSTDERRGRTRQTRPSTFSCARDGQ